MNFLKKLFTRNTARTTPASDPYAAGTTHLIDDPETGELFGDSIGPDHPMYDILMGAMASGNSVMGNLNDDGKWEVDVIDTKTQP